MVVAHDGAVMVTVLIPGTYIEVEFFTDGSVEIEWFVSPGVEAGSDADLDALIDVFHW